MYETEERPSQPEGCKPEIYDMHDVQCTFAGHVEARPDYVVNPEWVSESLRPSTTTYSTRRPWPWEMPPYRACTADHPPEVCNDEQCYCKLIDPSKRDQLMVRFNDQQNPPDAESGPYFKNLLEGPNKRVTFKEGQEEAEQRELWALELKEIRAYDCIPEPVSREERLRNATLQKDWLWDTYTHVVCTPVEGLLHDLRDMKYMNEDLLETPLQLAATVTN